MTEMDEAGPAAIDDSGAAFSLQDCKIVGKLPATDIERARQFYAEKLGVTPSREMSPSHYLYECGGSQVLLYQTHGRASVSHWIGEIAENEYRRTAWFKDSEGNLLDVAQRLDGRSV